MFKIKKLFFMFLLLLISNLLVPYDIQAISKSEANEFVNGFISAVRNADKHTIEQYLKNTESTIVDMFKTCNKCQDQDVISYPKSLAYWYMAEGSFKVGKLNKAYNCYGKAIVGMENIENTDELISALYRDRGWCIFCMRSNNSFEDINVKKAFDDMQKSYNFDSNDWLTIYYSGLMNITLGDTDSGLRQLESAQYLCSDSNGQQEIQQIIDEVKGQQPTFMDGVAEAVTNKDNWDFWIKCFKTGWKLGEFLDTGDIGVFNE